MLGKLLGSATRLVNTPAEALDRLAGDYDGKDDNERFASAPGEELAKSFDDADKGWSKD